VFEWSDFDDPGIVDQDVDPAEVLDGLADCRFNLCAIQQVTLNANCLAAALREVLVGLREFIWVASDERCFPAALANLSRDV
jgi:hypothetical protein